MGELRGYKHWRVDGDAIQKPAGPVIGTAAHFLGLVPYLEDHSCVNGSLVLDAFMERVPLQAPDLDGSLCLDAGMLIYPNPPPTHAALQGALVLDAEMRPGLHLLRASLVLEAEMIVLPSPPAPPQALFSLLVLDAVLLEPLPAAIGSLILDAELVPGFPSSSSDRLDLVLELPDEEPLSHRLDLALELTEASTSPPLDLVQESTEQTGVPGTDPGRVDLALEMYGMYETAPDPECDLWFQPFDVNADGLTFAFGDWHVSGGVLHIDGDSYAEMDLVPSVNWELSFDYRARNMGRLEIGLFDTTADYGAILHWPNTGPAAWLWYNLPGAGSPTFYGLQFRPPLIDTWQKITIIKAERRIGVRFDGAVGFWDPPFVGVQLPSVPNPWNVDLVWFRNAANLDADYDHFCLKTWS